jgi:acetyl-CoA C-acetyltransferase
MGDIAETVAEQFMISRDDQDRYALESHRRACAARDSGSFADEIVPVKVGRPGKEQIVDRDEGPRKETTLEQLGALRPVFRDAGTVTAGNASMISDGAAAVLVGSEGAGSRFGLKPLARIAQSFTAGGPPEELFTAPIAAVRGVVERAGLKLSDIDLFEINEAFSSQTLACMTQLELDPAKVNIHGGAIALGHPIGASGARVLITLLGALQRHGKQRGVATLCLGGGNAVAMVVEWV